ncbi:hypothetical protein SUGI_0618070 [Cryptomeria japonica]|uniref:vegetative cell wall protein gp1 n=1 Tax=Cryptomeria japonica TaxID=3369 RepID=UPI00241496A4|nr:vegetative cell wall protein gp1 [Cryptomeria japonica]GLJ30967.1 hypothetical protein SUGI_0618070 [Cryptomeria japonica]
MDDLVHPRRRRRNELQKVEKEGKLPGIILKGLFLALAVALMPVLHKQSPQLMAGYANHSTIARSWELINLVVIGLAISYGFISRRHNPTENNANDRAVAAQGAQNYVQKIFDFAEVFDNFCLPAEKVEAWSSRWQPQEPLVVIGTDDKEKPLLLPIRSLKSSLSNPEVFDFLEDPDFPSSKPDPTAAAVEESGKPPEVRNGTILSVESGNFDEELSNVIANEEEPAVFPSPIPWASRLDVLNNKEARPLVPAVVNLASDDGKIDPPAIPSPIPWRSRPDRDHDGKQKIGTENGDVSESKPPLPPPPQRPPPPRPETPKKSIERGVSPSPSPSSSPPRPRSLVFANGGSQKNMQASSGIPLQKFPSPRPSPSPPHPRSVELTNDNSQKNLQASPGIPLQKLASPRPSPSPPHPVFLENGSSQKNPNPKLQNSNEAAQAEGNNSAKDPTASAAPSFPTVAENGSSEKHHINGYLSIPKSPQHTAVPPVSQEFPHPEERLENSPAYTSNSRSKSGDDRSYLRGKDRECSSSRSNSRSKFRETSSDSSKNGRDCAEAARASRMLPSPRPPLPTPQASSYPDESTSISAPLPPPPPYSDDELSYENTTSSSEVLYQMEDSVSESEEEVDKKADQFIAKFHEQIRLQRVESMRRSQERHERKGDQ